MAETALKRLDLKRDFNLKSLGIKFNLRCLFSFDPSNGLEVFLIQVVSKYNSIFTSVSKKLIV